MRLQVFLMATALAASGAAAAPNGPEVRIQNVAARVRVIPESRSDVVVQVAAGKQIKAPRMTRDGASVVVDGGVNEKNFTLMGVKFGGVRCDVGRAIIPGHGWTPVADMALITVRTPLNARVVADGALYGEIGPSSSLSLSSAGCGHWSVGPVNGPATVHLAGEPIVAMTKVAQGLSADLSGAAKLTAAEVNTWLRIGTTGAAVVDITHGRANDGQLQLIGSGAITYGGEVGTLDTKVVGSGNIRVALVNGIATSATRGTGVAYIGRAKGKKFCPPDCQ